jgi:hypothetical protein
MFLLLELILDAWILAAYPMIDHLPACLPETMNGRKEELHASFSMIGHPCIAERVEPTLGFLTAENQSLLPWLFRPLSGEDSTSYLAYFHPPH